MEILDELSLPAIIGILAGLYFLSIALIHLAFEVLDRE